MHQTRFAIVIYIKIITIKPTMKSNTRTPLKSLPQSHFPRKETESDLALRNHNQRYTTVT